MHLITYDMITSLILQIVRAMISTTNANRLTRWRERVMSTERKPHIERQPSDWVASAPRLRIQSRLSESGIVVTFGNIQLLLLQILYPRLSEEADPKQAQCNLNTRACARQFENDFMYTPTPVPCIITLNVLITSLSYSFIPSIEWEWRLIIWRLPGSSDRDPWCSYVHSWLPK